MRRFYVFFRAWAVIIFFVAVTGWGNPSTISICFSAAPSYEVQTAPGNGAITMERRPVIQWLVYPNDNPIDVAQLSVDGQTVPVQQVATGKAVTLLYQPTTDLVPGRHTIEYMLTVGGFQSITLSSFFFITDKGPDLYGGKDRLKLVTMETEGLRVLNTYRQKLGLTALLRNEKLSMSAQAHANYLALNNVQSHYEQQGTVGFTGLKPKNRGAFWGYTGHIGEGISFSQPMDSLGIDRLMDAPYHRLGHINPNYREAGIAFSSQPESTIIEYGTPGISSDDRVMLYPYPGQIDTKISWFMAEDPNPLARYGLDKITVGYPISLSMHDDQTTEFKTKTATLTDDGGQSIPYYLVDSSQETDHKCHVFLIPVQPLFPGKTYTVTVSGLRIQKDGSTIPLTRTWSFSTLAELKIRHIGLITLNHGEYVEVITQNGDLPDLNYTLSQNGTILRSYVGQERQYYSYNGSLLENGEYFLEISSKSFSQKLNYKVNISGVGEDRVVKIVN